MRLDPSLGGLLLLATAGAGSLVSASCTVSYPGPEAGGRFHAAGFAASEVHGVDAKFQNLRCQQCHGENLDSGGTGSIMSCDTCHESGWRTQCVYCHGDSSRDATGAPPRELDGNTDEATLRFRSHQAHMNTDIAAPLGCQQCHGATPQNALDPGHWLDDTPGISEVRFAGLDANGTYAGGGQCGTLYCHGNGRGENGTVSHDAGPMGCTSCHPGMGSPTSALQSMSGEHFSNHLADGMTCVECHAGVSDAAGEKVIDAVRHLDGTPDVQFLEPGIQITGPVGDRRCTGPCHGFSHNDNW